MKDDQPLSYFPPILVGTNMGDITIWEIASRERLVIRDFKIWDLGACTAILKVCFTLPFSPFSPVLGRYFVVIVPSIDKPNLISFVPT